MARRNSARCGSAPAFALTLSLSLHGRVVVVIDVIILSWMCGGSLDVRVKKKPHAALYIGLAHLISIEVIFVQRCGLLPTGLRSEGPW